MLILVVCRISAESVKIAPIDSEPQYWRMIAMSDRQNPKFPFHWWPWRRRGRLGTSTAPAADPAGAVAGPPAASGPGDEPDALTAPGAVALFEHLTGYRCDADKKLFPGELGVLHRIEALLESGESLAAWVPRPPNMLPRLLACLHGTDPSLREAADLIRVDGTMVVEVVRLANSAGMRHGDPVRGLDQAVVRLGIQGLLRVVGVSLARPLFDAGRAPLLARAAPMLWRLSEEKCLLCYQRASVDEVDPFDAYLAGLTHNIGWIGAFRAMGQQPTLRAPYSAAFAERLARLAELLFGASAEQWQLNAALGQLGRALRASPLARSDLPLARVLRRADCEAMRKAFAPESGDPTAFRPPA